MHFDLFSQLMEVIDARTIMCNTSSFIVIFLLAGVAIISGDDIKGRLLTPEEGCGLTKVSNTRIVGGTPAKNGAWPWMTILAYSNERTFTFKCGGSLITSKHVLTAAHCISSNLWFARLGEHDLNSTDGEPHQDIAIALSVPHEHHEPIHKINDIGILHLEHDVDFSDRIRPICLPIHEPYLSRDFVDSNAFVAGWGITHDCENINHRSRVLLQVQVPVVDNEKCRELVYQDGAFYADVEIRDHVICAGGVGGKGFWQGDSGGPLMLPIHQNGSFPFYQIGIVNFSYGCARDNVPGVYARVQYHADWIKKQLENSTVTTNKTVE